MKRLNIQMNTILLPPTVITYKFIIVSACYLSLMVLSLFFLPLQSNAAMLGHDIDSNWTFAVSIEPSGEYGRSLAVGVTPDSINPDFTDFLFQAQGTVCVQIQTGYDGPDVGDTIITQIDYHGGSTSLEYISPNIVEVQLPTSAYYSNTDQNTGFSHTLYYTFHMAVVDGVGNENDPKTFSFGITVTKFRHLVLKHDYGAQLGRVFASDLKYVNDGSGYAVQRTAVIGEPVDLSTYSGVNIYPSNGVLQEYGQAGMMEFGLGCRLGLFEGDTPLQTDICASCSGIPPAHLTASISYAVVTSWNIGEGIQWKNNFSGWQSLNSMIALNIGSQLMMEPVIISQTMRYPSVTARFADGHMRRIALVQGEAKTLITIGGYDDFWKQPISWTVQYSNLAKDLWINKREYAKEYIYDGLVWLAFKNPNVTEQLGIPSSHSITKYLSQKTTQIGLRLWRKLMGKLSGGKAQKVQPERLLSAQIVKPAEHASFNILHSASVSQQVNREEGTQIFIAPPKQPFRTANLDISPDSALADYSISYKSDGSVDIMSRFGILEVSNLRSRSTVFLPPVSGAEITSTTYKTFPLDQYTTYGSGTLGIVPGYGVTISDRTPLITLSYDAPEVSLYKLETLECRVNGKLIEYITDLGDNEASFQISKADPLFIGDNSIVASIVGLQDGGLYQRYEASVTFTVNTIPSAPEGLTSAAGRDSMLLSWTPDIDPGIEGYNVYKGTTPGSINQKITAAPNPVPSYFIAASDDPGLSGGAWYAVTAVISGQESLLSDAVQGSLNPAANQMSPGEVTDLIVNAGDGKVAIEYTRPAGAISCKLERSTNGGVFQRIPSADTYLTQSTYTDDDVVNGNSYVYIITTIGNDLAEGTPSQSNAVTPADTAPMPPKGITVTQNKWNTTLYWNPSPESDLAYYNIYVSTNGKDFIKQNIEPPCTSTEYTLSWSPTPGACVYTVTAVDDAGNESEGSFPVIGGYTVNSKGVFFSLPFLNLLLN